MSPRLLTPLPVPVQTCCSPLQLGWGSEVGWLSLSHSAWTLGIDALSSNKVRICPSDAALKWRPNCESWFFFFFHFDYSENLNQRNLRLSSHGLLSCCIFRRGIMQNLLFWSFTSCYNIIIEDFWVGHIHWLKDFLILNAKCTYFL